MCSKQKRLEPFYPLKQNYYICIMKTILTTIFLSISFFVKSQTTDVMYVPDQKTLVASYNNYHNGIGMYVGGYLVTTFPTPYIYTTFMSRFNRIGLSFSNNKVAVMGGIFAESYYDSVSVKPDLWFKVFPFRIITNTDKGPDLVIGLNYMNGFRYGVGISIPFRAIY